MLSFLREILRTSVAEPDPASPGSSVELSPNISVRRIATVVVLFFYVASFVIFRDVLASIPSVLRGDSVIVGDELVPFFNPSSQLLEQAKGDFNELTHGYEFRVRYSFLTTWMRHYKVLPFAILLVLPTIFVAVYLTTARFLTRVFTTLSSSSIYLATAFPTSLIYMIMVYAKVTHFYTLIVGLALMTMSSLWMLQALLFEAKRWWRHAVAACVVALFNPAIHYLILFILFFALTVLTLFLGEFARWLRLGGPSSARKLPSDLVRFVRRKGRRRKLRYLRKKVFDSTLGRCAIAGLILLFVTLLPYALFVKFVALRGVTNLSETVPGDYYFIRDASVSWVHLLSWDLAGITDKILFGDYLAKTPRFPNIAYTLLLLVPLVVPPIRKRLFVTRSHRQLLGVIYVSIAFSCWATIGYAEPLWFPTFHRALAAVTRTMYSTESAAGDLTLSITSTVVQVLRFPHRFQLILFMLAPMVMSLSLAFGIDSLSKFWILKSDAPHEDTANKDIVNKGTAEDNAGKARGRNGHANTRAVSRNSVFLQLLATLCVASVFFTPFWSNAPYRKVYSDGNFGGFLAEYPLEDLRELKAELLELPQAKTVVLPPTETAKLVTDSNGIDHKFIDKFYIYYLDQPSYYYGLTGDTSNKFEFFMMLRGMYYQQDWWVNVARDIDVRYIVVNKTLRDNRGVGAEYLPNVENYIQPNIARLEDDLALRFENESFMLYELVDPPNPQRETLLVDSSWPSYLDLVFSRLDLSRCYNFEYLPYYSPENDENQPRLDSLDTLHVLTDNPQGTALDLYAKDNPELVFKTSTKIFAFNPDIVASSYYLSPMFRSFLFFSNTKWNRTEIITPGVFGSLNGSFIGVPRATQFDVPVTVAEPGRYRIVMRSASTANNLSISAETLGYDETFEFRSPASDLEMYTVDDVYQSDRVPVDVSDMPVDALEERIGDELVPVNLNFSYQELGVVDMAEGAHKFTIEKSDTNPMLFEGLVLIPEEDSNSLAIPDDVSIVSDPDALDCSERSTIQTDNRLYVDAAANAEHPDLTQEELLTLAASGVEDLVPNTSGGIGRSWMSLAATTLLLIASGLVVRWRSRPRREPKPPHH